MKKFYSILSLFIISIVASSNLSAQTCAPNTIFAEVTGNTWQQATNCQVTVLATAEWLNADILVTKNGVSISTGTATWNSGTGFLRSRGSIGFVCSEYASTGIVVQLSKNGVVCEATIAFSAALPIKLSAFNASLKGNNVQLNWSSELESLSSHYGVEKSSDGKNFSTIGTVAAAGVSNTPLNYSFTDNSFGGTAYYRLKLVDLDGTSEYSKVVYVNGGSSENTTLSVFPNPFRSDVQLKGINASDVNKSNIRVFSASGKEVNFKVTGSNSISIDPGVPQGIYMLRVKGQVYKLVKE